MSGAREQFDDARMVRLQTRLAALEARLQRFPFLDGTLVESVAIGIGATRVAHRLARAPRGALVVKASPDSALGFSATQPTDPQNAVHLEASAAATFTIWFW